MIWYFEDLLRSRAEREALDALATASDWLHPGEWRLDSSLRLIWDAEIATPHRIYRFSLQYPSHFPYSPPLVLPRDDSERWSDHQYGAGGELCTEHGPDNWQPHLTGADMIRSAHQLLSNEGPNDGSKQEVASRHSLTAGQGVRGHVWRMLVTEALRVAALPLANNEAAAMEFAGLYTRAALVYVPYSFKGPDGSTVRDNSVPEPIRTESSARNGLLVRWPKGVALPVAGGANALRSAIRDRGVDITNESVVIFVRGNAFHAYYLDDDDDSTLSFAMVNCCPAEQRLDTSYGTLASKKIALVGCGSIGSKIAVMLARAGVGEFLLVDDDIFLPDNLVRHDLDWREMGTHKAASLARRIKLVHPAVACESRHHRLGGQESSGSIETLISSLAKCDLIIDATASPEAFNYLTAASVIGKKPLLWAEIFGGGFGGLIARHRPGVEPHPMSMRSAVENWCAEHGRPYPKANNRYDVTEEEGAPMLATDADVTVIAAHAARLAEDTLLSVNPSAFPYSVYMLGLKQEWLFDAPFETHPIDVGPPGPQIPDIVVDPAIRDEEKARFLALLEKLANENSPAPEPTAAP